MLQGMNTNPVNIVVCNIKVGIVMTPCKSISVTLKQSRTEVQGPPNCPSQPNLKSPINHKWRALGFTSVRPPIRTDILCGALNYLQFPFKLLNFVQLEK